jgi:hypothetical protein
MAVVVVDVVVVVVENVKVVAVARDMKDVAECED